MKCNRCAVEDDSVQIRGDCDTCGPVALCSGCHSTHIEERRPTDLELVEALRALNKAIWLRHPKWASFSAETGEASRLISAWDEAQRQEKNDA